MLHLLNMFCQYIYLWMYALPAADLQGVLHLVSHSVVSAPSVRSACKTSSLLAYSCSKGSP